MALPTDGIRAGALTLFALLGIPLAVSPTCTFYPIFVIIIIHDLLFVKINNPFLGIFL